jgi:hypothetical protein
VCSPQNEVVGVSAFSENGFQFIFKKGDRSSIGGVEEDLTVWTDQVIPNDAKIAKIEVYFMTDTAEVSGLAFYDKEGTLLLFQSKILRENWAKEDHDAISEITLSGNEKVVGVVTGQIEGGDNRGVCYNLQLIISE